MPVDSSSMLIQTSYKDMQKLRWAVGHNFNPDAVSDKNMERCTAIHLVPCGEFQFLFRRHFGKNKFCLCFRLYGMQPTVPVCHGGNGNLMFLAPFPAGLSAGMECLQTFLPKCKFFVLFHDYSIPLRF